MQDSSYYAVIFTSKLSSKVEGYEKVAERMLELAREQKGFMGIESARDPSGQGVTVSYWSTLEDINIWKKNSEHLQAQKLGQNKWYESYHVRICKVEREYTFL